MNLSEVEGTVINDDATDVLAKMPDGCVDLIFTDPPYLKKFFHCYKLLFQHAARLLKDGGSLITIVPSYNWENVLALNILASPERKLKWRWDLEMNMGAHSHARLGMGIVVGHKPMGWWVKGSWPTGRGFVEDTVPVRAPSKKLHAWQQDISWCDYYIGRICPPGGLVLDPFAGSGTAGIACLLHDRRFIGIEVDPVHAVRANLRLSEFDPVLARAVQIEMFPKETRWKDHRSKRPSYKSWTLEGRLTE